jgi:peptidoglycan/xylan/chitin deacetylase (PgdA/CDA1 family)
MNDPVRFLEVLDHATANDIGLMIFPTGNCVMMFENLWDIDLVGEVRARGHWIGNHTLTHPRLTSLSQAEVVRQITGWAESNMLRPPFGDWNRMVWEAANSVGMRLVMWDLDTDDWQGRSESEIVTHIYRYAQPGYNVLMHLQHQGFSTTALDGIQATLRSRGVELCRPAPAEQRPTPVHVPDNIC